MSSVIYNFKNSQASCVKLYKEIADYNADIVWVKCLGIWNSNVKEIVSDVTFDIKTILVRLFDYYMRFVQLL